MCSYSKRFLPTPRKYWQHCSSALWIPACSKQILVYICREQLARTLLDSSLVPLLGKAFDKLIKAIEDVGLQSDQFCKTLYMMHRMYLFVVKCLRDSGDLKEGRMWLLQAASNEQLGQALIIVLQAVEDLSFAQYKGKARHLRRIAKAAIQRAWWHDTRFLSRLQGTFRSSVTCRVRLKRCHPWQGEVQPVCGKNSSSCKVQVRGYFVFVSCAASKPQLPSSQLLNSGAECLA